jgi:hypothetical protein
MANREVDPVRFDEPIYVVCEGPADARLVRRLLEREDLEGFSVNYAKGYEKFAQHIQGLRTSSDWRKLRRLLIIGDNDTKPAARWQNAQDALTDEGLPAPDHHADIVHGSHDGPSTGIFMMPSADKFGALETLLVQAILQKHEGLAECLQQLDECPVSDCGGWDAVKRAKMQFQTIVAITCRDDPSAGAAHIWSKRHNPVPVASPVFDELVAFLRRAAEV